MSLPWDRGRFVMTALTLDGLIRLPSTDNFVRDCSFQTYTHIYIYNIYTPRRTQRLDDNRDVTRGRPMSRVVHLHGTIFGFEARSAAFEMLELPLWWYREKGNSM